MNFIFIFQPSFFYIWRPRPFLQTAPMKTRDVMIRADIAQRRYGLATFGGGDGTTLMKIASRRWV